MNKQPRLTTLAAGGLFLAAALAFFFWHEANRLPAGHDAAQHLSLALDYDLALRQDAEVLRETLARQPARYLPLPHLTAGSLMLAAADRARACRLAQAWWALLFAVFLWLISRELAEKSWLALFPPLVMLANPVTWTVLTDFNFELPLLAAATVWLTLLLGAGRLTTRGGVVAAVVLLALTALIKPQLIVLILPGGLLLAYTGGEAERFRRRLFLVSYLAIFIGWMLWSRGTTAHEFAVDYWGYPDDRFGWWYYARLFLFGYRGLTLTIALLFVLAWRWRGDGLRREDGAFLLFFLAPLVFYSAIQTKRPWYLLAGYQALPLWFVYQARRLWDKRLVKAMGLAAVLVYALPAAGNLALVGAAARINDRETLKLAGIEPPQPPTPSEEVMVREINRVARAALHDAILVDLWATEIRADRLWTLLLLDNPCLAAVPHVSPGWQMHDYVDQLLHAGFLFTCTEQWPTLEQLPYPPAEKEAARRAWQAAEGIARRRFVRHRSWELPDGGTLVLFRAGDRDRYTSPLAVPAICGGQTASPSDPRADKEAGLAAYEEKDFKTARERLLAAFAGDAKDFEALAWAAKAAMRGESWPATEQLWRRFFAQAVSFGMKIDILNELADPPWINLVPRDGFYRLYDLLLEDHHEDSMERYSLLLARQKYEQNSGDWPAALQTVGLIKETAAPEQLDGVRLSEALIFLRAQRQDEARQIFRELTANASPEQPIYADAALQLARLQVEAEDYNEAKQSLQAAVRGVYDQNSLVNLVSEMAQRRVAADDRAAAEELLVWAEEQVAGQSRGLLLLERGKLCLVAGEIEAARSLFEAAAQLVEDPVSREWLSQTLQAIARREYGPIGAEGESDEGNP